MSRRSSLPGAAELFRSTGSTPADRESEPPPAGPPTAAPHRPPAQPSTADDGVPTTRELPDPIPVRAVRRRPRVTGERRPSGRERHDEKITVYVSADELMDLEHARLGLRGDHGLAVDRGRIVREALAHVIADLETRGEASILVRRLRGL